MKPQRTQRKIRINKGYNLLLASLLCALVKRKPSNVLAYTMITGKHTERVEMILFLVMRFFSEFSAVKF